MSSPPKRPRDMMQLARMVGELAAHETVEPEAPVVNEAAVKRGKARADSLTPAKRSSIAKKAARTRWKKEG